MGRPRGGGYIYVPMPAALQLKRSIPDPVRILLIEGDQACAERVVGALGRIEWAYARIDVAASLRQALARLKLETFDLIITCLDLPDSEGLATLEQVASAFDRRHRDDAGIRRGGAVFVVERLAASRHRRPSGMRGRPRGRAPARRGRTTSFGQMN